MAVVTLRDVSKILQNISEKKLANDCIKLSKEIKEGIKRYGVIKHKMFGKIFAYEVDGFGSHCLMDDPNVPSLLSLPYLGYCSTKNPVYVATRKFILSNWNPFFAKGKISALTSPHQGTFNQFWPNLICRVTKPHSWNVPRCNKCVRLSFFVFTIMNSCIKCVW